MFSLEHSVNLSRRACRLYALVLILYCGVGLCLLKPPNHATDNFMHSPSEHHDSNSLPADLNLLHQQQQAAARKDGEVTTTSSTTTFTTDATAEDFTEGGDAVQKKQVQRYPVASVSFHRVETPFIIGMWIFCASLAKIGK